jgi:hypothetical protein
MSYSDCAVRNRRNGLVQMVQQIIDIVPAAARYAQDGHLADNGYISGTYQRH